jgi:hypothetical protein
LNLKSSRFISEPIKAIFDEKPALEKRPGCPDKFIWRGEEFQVVDLLSEWHNYQRRGRMARNMAPTHASVASTRGSWGVGQDYYQVRTNKGIIFEIYFDRAPSDSDHRKGNWFIYRELVE